MLQVNNPLEANDIINIILNKSNNQSRDQIMNMIVFIKNYHVFIPT